MDEAVLKKVCKFLKKQKDSEAVFQTFWEGTKDLYPSDLSKTKVKAWLKEHPERFEIIKSETGNPFGKIKLKVEKSDVVLPSTTEAEDVQIAQKLIECIDNRDENGYLFAIICKNKAGIFPEKLQDKKHIRKWITQHEKWFKVVYEANGGLHSVEVMNKARHLKNREPAVKHRARQPKPKEGNESADLLKLADNIVLRVSEKISKEGETIPFENLFAAKEVISPLCTEEALMNFLAAFPSKFEVIELGGLGKWVHLKGTNDAISKVTSFIFQNGGTVPFGNLVKQSGALIGGTVDSSDALLTWLNSNVDIFEVITKPGDTKPWQVKVHVRSPPRFCHNYVTQGQCPRKKCQFLHICKAFVCQRPHNIAECPLSHNIRDEHNKVIIDKMGALSKETDEVVVNVLFKSFFPRVCSEYNKNALCPRGDNCHFLHVCGDYILNQCGKTVCLLSHNLVDNLHNINVLKKYALLPSQKLSDDIVKANIAFAQVAKPHASQSVEIGMTKPQPDHISTKKAAKASAGSTGEKKKRTRRRPRHRGRKSSQASSAVDDSGSEETDSSDADQDNASNVSSSCHYAPPSLSLHNIQMGDLATPLTGYQKVGNWIGNPYGIGTGNSEKSFNPTESRKRSDSTSSSEVSVVSAQSSIISTQSTTWQDDEQKRIFMTILKEYNGDAPFNKISKEFFKGAVVEALKWFQSQPHKFILHRNGQGKVDTVSAFSVRARICLDYNGTRSCSKPDCGFLHICRYYVEGHCPKGKACNLNHSLGSHEVSQAVKRMGLQELPLDQLLTLIRASVPAVCHFYNQERCNRNEFCPRLHVCKEYAKGRRFCQAKPCKFGHEQALKQDAATKILKMYKLYGKKPNYKYIKKMIFVFDTRRQSSEQQQHRVEGHGPHEVEERSAGRRHDTRGPDALQRATPGSPRNLMDIDFTQIVDNSAQEKEKVQEKVQEKEKEKVQEKEKEKVQEKEEVARNICHQFLLGQCHTKKCPGLHFALPYCWQFKLCNSTVSWCNFKKIDCVNIEKYFCDVNCTDAGLNISTNISGCESSIRLDFQSMSGHPQPSSGDGFKIRRLECRRMTAHESEAWYETQWTWYQFSSSRLVKCDASKGSMMEELFLNGNLSSNWSTFRRRPALFLTEKEVEEKKRDSQEREAVSTPAMQPPPSSSEPAQPTSRSVEESVVEPSNCLRTRVEPGSLEYKDIEKLLGNTLLVINHIEKIVSDGLWQKYKSKKKTMTDELPIGESLKDGRLFIPCLHDDIERIVKGNICDSRIILNNRPFGPGYYFTSNASSCIEWCREHYPHSRLSLIVCQVLLGTYTQGSPGLKEFPRRANGRFYDSLVDNKDDPSVFVVENVDQCYPAFVIDFSPASTPVDNTATMLQGFTIIDNNRVSAQEILPPPPAYQHVPAHQPISHPLLPNYGPESINRPPVVLQQQPSSPNTPSTPFEYVKAAPPYSERAPPTSDAPPEYTPYAQPTRTQARDVPPRPPGRTAPNQSGFSKDKKDCVVM